MAKTITREEIKSKDLRREYKRFIGEKKLDYYLSVWRKKTTVCRLICPL